MSSDGDAAGRHVPVLRDRVVVQQWRLCGRDLALRWREEGGSRDVRQERRMCDEWLLRVLQEASAKEEWEVVRHRNEQPWALTHHDRV